MNVTNKLNELKLRKFGDDVIKGPIFENFTGKISDQLLYITEAMSPVSRSYTENTFEQCSRVQEQLRSNISAKHSTIKFEYQGSVPLNTHTRRHSDVDILVATGRYSWVTPPLPVAYPYTGNPVNDLIELREDIVSTIKLKFPAVLLDDTGGKAVAISGGSLKRKMDLVPIAWVNNIYSNQSSELTNRGIKLYDKNSISYVENYPFKHIFLCNQKDVHVDRKFKKLVRYIKNVRRDADQKIDISSYDATALMYHQSNYQLQITQDNPAALSIVTEQYLKSIIDDPNLQATLKVPNETRLLFCKDGLKISEVVKLYKEIREINSDLNFSYSSIDTLRRRSLEEYFRKAS